MIHSKEKIEALKHRWTTNKGKALIKTIKKTRCYLSPVLFRQHVNHFAGINDPELGDDAVDLRGAPLSGFDFRSPIEDENGFAEKLAILSNIHFEGAVLKYCIFQDGKLFDCHFDQSDLSHSEFKTSNLNNCSFKEADCTGINFHGAVLTNCDFNDAVIRDISFDSTIIDERTDFGKILKSEKDNNYHFASIEYKQIKEMYKNSSLHTLADTFHYKEMVAKRKITDKRSPKRWLNYIFGDMLCKYGTSFVHVILWSIILIITCAFAYWAGDHLVHNNLRIQPNLLDSIYFSIVTFTTVGYGDYYAVGYMRFLAATEGFLGAALMALFTVIVARNIIRD